MREGRDGGREREGEMKAEWGRERGGRGGEREREEGGERWREK